MAQRLNPGAIENASWWCGRFELVHHLEYPSTHLDPTIHRLRRETVRRHPDLRQFLEILGVPPLWMLAYQALAEGPYGMVRVAALFPTSPFKGGEPQVFALDGDRRSLHRNPPYDDGVEGVSAHLCLTTGTIRTSGAGRRSTVSSSCSTWPAGTSSASTSGARPTSGRRRMRPTASRDRRGADPSSGWRRCARRRSR